MATVLLTGATGTVGSALAPCLKARGNKVICLVRPDHNLDPAERMRRIFGGAPVADAIWPGDITLPLAGVSDSERNGWRGRIDKIVHCASSISFDESRDAATATINVVGTGTMLNLAEDLRVPEIHYVNTAYIAGDADYFGENDFDVGQRPRNTYERTKFDAERLIRRWRGRKSIYRLAIVVGDSATGFTPKFTGYYRPFAFFYQLRQFLQRKLGSAVMRKYQDDGVVFNGGENLILPIRINCSPVSTLNLVPRDWVAETMAKLVGIPASGTTFHLAHPGPRRIREITDISLILLGIKGYSYGPYNGNGNGHEQGSALKRLQEGFDRSAEAYLPYIIHEAEFGCGNMERVLGADFVAPPDVDEKFFAVLLDYAKSVGFGKPEQSQLQAVGV